MDNSNHTAAQPRHSTPVKRYGNSEYRSEASPGLRSSANSSSGVMSMGDLESTTVEKQRKELQLLICELKDRDRELNDMVAAHQQQLAAWERDRQRALTLERRNEKFEGELKKRHEQIRLLIQRLKVSESKHKSKDSAIESSQVRMKQLERDVSSTSYHLQDLKEKNTSLNTSLTDMSSKVNGMETREQELLALLRIKEKELLDVTGHASTLSSKLRCLDAELQDSKRSENRSRSEVENERTRYKQTKAEIDNIKAEMLEKTNEMLSYRRDISALKDEIHKLQREVFMRDDEIRRKDDLIEIQMSKQERTDKELAALRMIYERQQKELATLHISLSDSQDMLEKQEERLNHISGSRLDKKVVSFTSTDMESRSVTDTTVTSSNKFKELNGGELVEPIVEQTLDKKAGFSEQPKNSVMQAATDQEDQKLSQNGLDLSDFEDCCSDATNDLIEEARKSASSSGILQEFEDGDVKQHVYSQSSPTSKLQKLLAESREMVHNLERAALTPVPRPNSARAANDRSPY